MRSVFIYLISAVLVRRQALKHVGKLYPVGCFTDASLNWIYMFSSNNIYPYSLSALFFNCNFCEMTYHSIHLFKVYNLVVFNNSQSWCVHLHFLISEHFSTLEGNPVPTSSHPSFPLPRTSSITNVSSVSLNLLFWTLHVNEIIQYVTFVTVCFDLE